MKLIVIKEVTAVEMSSDKLNKGTSSCIKSTAIIQLLFTTNLAFFLLLPSPFLLFLVNDDVW